MPKPITMLRIHSKNAEWGFTYILTKDCDKMTK